MTMLFYSGKQGNERGQTVIELLVALSMIAILSGLLVLYTRTGEIQARLSRDEEQLAVNLRRVQDEALLSQGIASGQIPCGYGVHFDPGATNYILFADLVPPGSTCTNENFRYDPGEAIETVNLEPGIKILSTTASDIVFIPPEPHTIFTPSATKATITLAIGNQTAFTRTVNVTQLGQITASAP